jgi:hypothetical protein
MATAIQAPRGSAADLLHQARIVLDEARLTSDAGERFRLAHLSALRAGAAVLALRGRPAATRRRLVPIWALLAKMAPEHADWAAFFAAGAAVRAAVEAGAASAVSPRAADDQVRAAEEFLAIVADSAGMLAA